MKPPAVRAQRVIDPGRVARRSSFIDLLRAEGRSRVVEVGTGPGQDAAALLAAGFDVAGVDLSPEHVRLARETGVDARLASVLDLPFANDSFPAGWTMSTLLHVADSEFDAALTEICRVLATGSPLAVGLWSSGDWEGPNEHDTIQPPRFFSSRSDQRVREMLAPFGTIERFATWADRGADWHYQWVLLRTTE